MGVICYGSDMPGGLRYPAEFSRAVAADQEDCGAGC